MARKKLIDKQAAKHYQGKCYFCEVSDYSCLHCHRIVEGAQGGEYTDFNVVVVCANHHAKIHDGQIKIDRKYNSTNGKTILHYWDNGEEKWV